MINSANDELRGEMKEMKDELRGEIRGNGVLMEELKDSIQQIADGNASLHAKFDRINERSDTNQIERVPLLWEAVKGHSKRIKALEEARAS